MLLLVHFGLVLALAPNRITLGGNFQWAADLHPVWTSVFMRSSDFVPDMPLVLTSMRAFRKHEVEFVTVIGGMSYLNFLNHARFKRVTFFDQNINEVSKLLVLHKELATRPFSEYNYFHDVDQTIRSNPGEFYLPKPLADLGFTLTSNDEFVFPPKDWNVPGKSMWTLLPPGSDCATGGCWNPDETLYRRVQEVVRRRK
jgi:hypothetical protein